jgi:CheY-like chemotaxis protein
MLLELGFKKENLTEYATLADFEIGNEELVLSDLNLPDSSGRDTLRAVLDRANTKNAVVIVLSGLADEKLAQEAIQMGAQDYLIKATFGTGILKKTLSFAFERNHSMETKAAKRAEVASDNTMEIALGLVPSWVFRCDDRLVIDFQSKPMHQREPDRIGSQVSELFPDDQKNKVVEQLHLALESGETKSFEAEWELGTGVRSRISCVASAIGGSKVYLVITSFA